MTWNTHCHILGYVFCMLLHGFNLFSTYQTRIVNSEYKRADIQNIYEECRTSRRGVNIQTWLMQCCLSWSADRELGPWKEQAKNSVLAVGGRLLDLGNHTPLQVSCINFGKYFCLSLLWFPTCKMEKITDPTYATRMTPDQLHLREDGKPQTSQCQADKPVLRCPV